MSNTFVSGSGMTKKKAGGQLSVVLDNTDWGRLIGLKHRMELELGIVLTITEVIKAILSAACVLDLTPRAENTPEQPASAIPANTGCGTCHHCEDGKDYKCTYCGRLLLDNIASRDLESAGDAFDQRVKIETVPIAQPDKKPRTRSKKGGK